MNSIKLFLLLLTMGFSFSCMKRSSNNDVESENEIEGFSDTQNVKHCMAISSVGIYELGIIIDSNGREYHVSSSFQKIPTASSFRGISKVIFESENSIFSYRLDLPSELPYAIDSVENTLIYCRNDSVKSEKFKGIEKLLCTPFGCF
ncbi:MAG: hypothetical protein COA58_01140 [Bacteroidetes bacterium]|nr:MAG: hypothetical protein COA58_01140 [Bacteroidota bacterium]